MAYDLTILNTPQAVQRATGMLGPLPAPDNPFESRLPNDLTLSLQGVKFEASNPLPRVKSGELVNTNAGDYLFVTSFVADSQGVHEVQAIVADTGASEDLAVVGIVGQNVTTPIAAQITEQVVNEDVVSGAGTPGSASAVVEGDSGIIYAAPASHQVTEEVVSSEYYSQQQAAAQAEYEAAAAATAAAYAADQAALQTQYAELAAYDPSYYAPPPVAPEGFVTYYDAGTPTGVIYVSEAAVPEYDPTYTGVPTTDENAMLYAEMAALGLL